MFGTVVDRIQGLLSRSFLLANFFPFLIFFVLNGAIAYLGLPGAADKLVSLWPGDAGDRATLLATALVGVAISAYVFSPLTAVVRRILEGRTLPPKVRAWLLQRQRNERDNLISNVHNALRRYDEFQHAARALQELQQARRDGNMRNAGTDARVVKRAARALEKVVKERSGPGLLRPPTLFEAIKQTKAALAANAADLDQASAGADVARRLDRIQLGLIDEILAAERQAVADYSIAVYRHQSRFAPNEEIRPTRLGNLSAVIESYSQRMYHADFDFLWPRLQLVLLRDEKFAAVVDAAKTQADFALLMLLLTGLTAAVWLPVLLIAGTSPALFLISGIAGPMAIWWSYLLVEETQRSYAEVVRAAIDGFRVQLLAALRQPLPTSLSAERARWRRLQEATDDGRNTDLPLRHDGK